jgi:multiple sugar transport system ATP-binding protein
MNHGVVEQFGRPQEIYDWPATKFVAKFIGSPPMNFLDFDGTIDVGGNQVDLSGKQVDVPVSRQAATGRLTLGVRPENVIFSDASTFRGRVVATEYLGTTQIVTLDTSNGELKARISSADIIRPGELIGIKFRSRTLTVFAGDRGLALRSEGNEGVLTHG